MLTKAISLKIKDIDMGKREAVIAHATYQTLDRDKDRANRGMFDKSWKENKGLVRLFLNHDKTLAPGKPINFWDDSEHAYTQVKLGTHSLGDDVLKQLDEQIIVAASYGFIPVKQKKIKDKGYDYLEVQHLETSVLTHWGAHDESGVVSVTKSLAMPSLRLKQLTSDEQALLQRLINSGMQNIQDCMDLAIGLTPDSDMYTAIQYYISRLSDQLGDMKSQLRYGMKEAQEIEEQVRKMQKFIRNTSASDECIQSVTKSLNSLLNKKANTAGTDSAMIECPKCRVITVGDRSDESIIKCADCGYIIKGKQPSASSKSEEIRRKLLLLNSKLI